MLHYVYVLALLFFSLFFPAQLMAELARVNLRLDQQQGGASADAPHRSPKRPRPVLPDPETFDGINRAMYLQFKTKLLAKLSVDREALGGPNERLWYAFGRLSGSAAAQILPWISIHAASMRGCALWMPQVITFGIPY